MKRILLYLFAFVLMFSGCENKNQDEEQLPVDTTQLYQIPDVNLVKALVDIGFEFKDGYLKVDEKLSEIRELDLSQRGIESLVGLELFTELRKLNLSHNQLKTLDIAWIGLTQLRELDISFNCLKEFDITPLTRLETLKLQGNAELEALNGLSPERFPYLKILYLPSTLENQSEVVEFYYRKRYIQPGLDMRVEKVGSTDMAVFDNLYLLVVDVNFRNYLKTLGALRNAFRGEYVNLEKLALITELECPKLSIRSMTELRFFPALTMLICNENGLKELDLSKNVNLEWIDFSDNQLSKIDLTKNPKLINLFCNGNNLSELNLSENHELQHFTCISNMLSRLDISQQPKLLDIGCDFNPLQVLDCEKNVLLRHISCEYCIIKELKVSTCVNLIDLICSNNMLTKVNVTNNKNMLQFHCMYNKIKELDLSGMDKLRTALFGENELKYLNIEGTASLTGLSCLGILMTLPDIEGLDAAVHTKLKFLHIPTTAVCGANIQRFYQEKSNNIPITWGPINSPYTANTCNEQQNIQ